MSIEQKGKKIPSHRYPDMNENKYFSSVIFAEVKHIRVSNADQHVLKFQPNFLESNLAIRIKNIKHIHGFRVKLHALGSLLRNYSKAAGGWGGWRGGYLHTQTVFIHSVLVIRGKKAT